LADAFNGALERIEQAYTQLEAFNADVAHELRTPLANLIGETQVALARERSAGEFKDVLQSNLEELDRIRSIVNDMLFLARSDQGEAATARVPASVAARCRRRWISSSSCSMTRACPSRWPVTSMPRPPWKRHCSSAP
jgi:two-component system heavy metal sensor histidine kinase CusS